MFKAFCLGRLEVAVGLAEPESRFDVLTSADIECRGGIAELENTIDR